MASFWAVQEYCCLKALITVMFISNLAINCNTFCKKILHFPFFNICLRYFIPKASFTKPSGTFS